MQVNDIVEVHYKDDRVIEVALKIPYSWGVLVEHYTGAETLIPWSSIDNIFIRHPNQNNFPEGIKTQLKEGRLPPANDPQYYPRKVTDNSQA